MTDGAIVTPLLEGVAPKLSTLVGDDVLGRETSVTNRSVEGPLNVGGRQVVAEDGETDYGAGEVIDHHGDPPAEGPRK